MEDSSSGCCWRRRRTTAAAVLLGVYVCLLMSQAAQGRRIDVDMSSGSFAQLEVLSSADEHAVMGDGTAPADIAPKVYANAMLTKVFSVMATTPATTKAASGNQAFGLCACADQVLPKEHRINPSTAARKVTRGQAVAAPLIPNDCDKQEAPDSEHPLAEYEALIRQEEAAREKAEENGEAEASSSSSFLEEDEAAGRSHTGSGTEAGGDPVLWRTQDNSFRARLALEDLALDSSEMEADKGGDIAYGTTVQDCAAALLRVLDPNGKGSLRQDHFVKGMEPFVEAQIRSTQLRTAFRDHGKALFSKVKPRCRKGPTSTTSAALLETEQAAPEGGNASSEQASLKAWRDRLMVKLVARAISHHLHEMVACPALEVGANAHQRIFEEVPLSPPWGHLKKFGLSEKLKWKS